jgi:uncharacterized protein (TIGR00369 family)
MTDEEHRAIAQAMNEGSPQARALGFETLEIGHGVAILKVPYRPEIVGDPETGVIAGGVVTTLLDHTCGQAVHAAQAEWGFIATLDLRIDYMRPAEPGRDLKARAHCYKMTGRSPSSAPWPTRTIPKTRSPPPRPPSCWTPARAGNPAPISSRRNRRSSHRPIHRQDGRRGMSDAPMNAQDRLNAVLASIPYARFIGVRAELAGDEMTAVLPFSDLIVGNPILPAIHGGVLGAFMEMTALAQLSIFEPLKRQPRTIDVSIEYLRSGRP